jgi:hypothetical protein
MTARWLECPSCGIPNIAGRSWGGGPRRVRCDHCGHEDTFMGDQHVEVEPDWSGRDPYKAMWDLPAEELVLWVSRKAKPGSPLSELARAVLSGRAADKAVTAAQFSTKAAQWTAVATIALAVIAVVTLVASFS